MDYVADAHAVVWRFFAPQRVGPAAQAAFDAAHAGAARIYLPAVALAEVIMVIEKQRLPGVPMAQLINRLQWMQSSSNYELLPLLPETVMASHRLTAIPDIFDRLIVAEAQRLGFPLISRDPVIRASNLVRVVWE
jgi:PIN domain nuclease of toxin-antitoxin system